MLRILFDLAVLAATFYAGARYGRRAEAKALAAAFRVEAYGRMELQNALNAIRQFRSVKFARIKKFL